MRLPQGWVDLGEGEQVEEAARRLAAGLLLGRTDSGRYCWVDMAHLPDFCRLTADPLPPVAPNWTLIQWRPAANCRLRWYACRRPLASALADLPASPATSFELGLSVDRETHDGWFDLAGSRFSFETSEDDLAEAHRTLRRLTGLRYQGRLVVGSKVVLRHSILSAEPGDVGLVYEVYSRTSHDDGESEGYGVIFPSGGYDGFSPDDVDWLLDVTPEVSERYRRYEFRNVGRLPQDFADASDFVLLPGTLAVMQGAVGASRYAW